MVKHTTKTAGDDKQSNEHQTRAEERGWFMVANHHNGDHLFFSLKHGYVIAKGWDDLCATHHSLKTEEESK